MRQVVNLQSGQITFEEDAPALPQSAAELQSAINAESLAYLDSTDWYVIRLTETFVEIPDDVLKARQAARDAIK